MPVVYLKRIYYDAIVQRGEKPEEVINELVKVYLENIRRKVDKNERR